MDLSNAENIDTRVGQALTAWKKIDETNLKILEGLSLHGPRNLSAIAERINLPATTVRYRIKKMLEDNILFLHLNPFHTNMGLRKAIVFAEAQPGYEDTLLDCMKVNDFWLSAYRLYGPYEGCGGTWTVPRDNVVEFKEFFQDLLDLGIARSIEVNWTTCHEGIPVRKRWYMPKRRTWIFSWDEWIRELNNEKGELPYTLVEPDDWPILVDEEDLLIAKELEIDGRQTLTQVSKKLGIPLEKVKYHFREHLSKRNLIEGYQVEIYRTPFPLSEVLLFKFEFSSYEKFKKFTLSLHDKPFPIWMGKVIGENALMAQIYLPKWEFRRFITALSNLIRSGHLVNYHYVIEDMYQASRQTIPYQYFKDGYWSYDIDEFKARVAKIVEKAAPDWNGLKQL